MRACHRVFVECVTYSTQRTTAPMYTIDLSYDGAETSSLLSESIARVLADHAIHDTRLGNCVLTRGVST